MGRLDDLLKKAQEAGQKETEKNSLFQSASARNEKLDALQAKMLRLQVDDKLLAILGNYPLKGVILQVYQTPQSSDSPHLGILQIGHDFVERKEPFMHFYLENSDRGGQERLDIRKTQDVAKVLQYFPEITPDLLESNLYDAIEQKLIDGV